MKNDDIVTGDINQGADGIVLCVSCDIGEILTNL